MRKCFKCEEPLTKGSYCEKCKTKTMIDILRATIFSPDTAQTSILGVLSSDPDVVKRRNSARREDSRRYKRTPESKAWSLKYTREIRWVDTLIKGTLNSSEQRGFATPEIDKRWVEEQYLRQEGRCFWTNCELVPSSERYGIHRPSLDRLDPDGSYTKDNTVITCTAANRLRNRASRSDTVEFLGVMRGEMAPPAIFIDDSWIARTTHAIEYRSSKRGLESTITRGDVTQLLALQQGKCAYTGLPLNSDAFMFKPSIDRIDSSRGYTRDNVAIVCLSINYAKSVIDIDRFIQWLLEISH